MPDTQTQKTTVRLALIFEAAIIPAALAGIYLLGINVHTQGLALLPSILLGTGAGGATFGLLYVLSRGPGLLGSTLSQHGRQLQQFVSGFSLTGIVWLAVLAGVGEELFFRGLIQGWVTEHGGSIAGVAVSAVLFGLVHFLSPAYFLVATLMGAALGIAYALSESIVLVMVWHGVYDCTALIALKHYPQLLQGTTDEP